MLIDETPVRHGLYTKISMIPETNNDKSDPGGATNFVSYKQRRAFLEIFDLSHRLVLPTVDPQIQRDKPFDI